MNKKGFTLVELLSILVVIGIIAIISISIVTDKISLSKRKSYDIQVDNIINATKNYILAEENLDPDHVNTLCIYVSELQNKGYIKKGKIINPVNNDNIAALVNGRSKGVVTVKFDENTMQYNYDFSIDGCTPNIVTPAYKTILKNEDVKAVGKTDGLYEENNEYVFKGENPNNYINFNNSTWRIVSIDKETNMLKIVKLVSDPKTLPENKVDGLVNDLNEAINTENSSYKDVIDYINVNSKWNKGIVSSIDSAITLKSQEKQSNDYKTINLLTLSDYVDASTNNNCFQSTCTSYLSTSSNYWLLTQTSDGKNWYINDENKIGISEESDPLYNVYPVLYLKSSVEIDSGSGTSSEPYILK